MLKGYAEGILEDMTERERHALSVLCKERSLSDTQLKNHEITLADVDALVGAGLVEHTVVHTLRHATSHYRPTDDGIHVENVMREALDGKLTE